MVVVMAMPKPFSPAERLIDQGRIIRHVEQHGCQKSRDELARISSQKRAISLLAAEAAREYPALMMKAMMEDWSEFKVRFEVNKCRGKAGK